MLVQDKCRHNPVCISVLEKEKGSQSGVSVSVLVQEKCRHNPV